MKKLEIKVSNYNPKYAEHTVKMWRDSKERAIRQAENHSFENHLYFLNHILSKQYQIDLALIDEKVVGMIAYSETEISQLYIHIDYQGNGIGNGFEITGKGQENEENLPDIRYELKL